MKRTLTRRTALLVLILVPLACSSPKERARKKLGEMNITYDQETFVERVKAGDAIVVDQFLAAGMNPNAMNKEGKTALIVASQMGRPALVQLLLDRGAGVNVADAKFRATPLIWAGLSNNSQVTKLLLEHGANPKAKEAQGGTTALQAAAGRGNLESVQMLLAKGAPLNDKDKLSRTPSMLAAARGRNTVLRVLAEKGADLKTVDREGNTALMWAAKSGNAETVKLLLERGANVNAVNLAGLTALLHRPHRRPVRNRVDAREGRCGSAKRTWWKEDHLRLPASETIEVRRLRASGFGLQGLDVGFRTHVGSCPARP